MNRSLPGGEPEPMRFGKAENDRVIAQMIEQFAPKDKQLAELAGRLADLASQLADQNQRIASQSKKIADQEREIHTQKRQIEEKDQQLAQANREVRDMLARMVQREEPLRQTNAGPGVGETLQREVNMLRGELERQKSLVNQVCDQI